MWIYLLIKDNAKYSEFLSFFNFIIRDKAIVRNF